MHKNRHKHARALLAVTVWEFVRASTSWFGSWWLLPATSLLQMQCAGCFGNACVKLPVLWYLLDEPRLIGANKADFRVKPSIFRFKSTCMTLHTCSNLNANWNKCDHCVRSFRNTIRKRARKGTEVSAHSSWKKHFFSLGRAQKDRQRCWWDSKQRRAGEEDAQHKHTKFSCIEMKCGAIKYLRFSVTEVLDHKGKEEEYSQWAGALMDFCVTRAL